MSRLEERLIRRARYAMAQAAATRTQALIDDKPGKVRMGARLERAARLRYLEAMRLAEMEA